MPPRSKKITVGSESITKPTEAPLILNFADHFTSPPFITLVGPIGTAFYLNKTLLAKKSLYFKGLLEGSFKGKESEANTVALNDAVDNVTAFRMFVEYLYLGTYTPREELDIGSRCFLHARVYFLAQKLLVDDLKELALEKMVAELAKAGYKKYNDWEGTYEFAGKALGVKALVELIRIVYEHTEDTFSEQIGTLSGAAASGESGGHSAGRSDDPAEVLFDQNKYTGERGNGDISIETGDEGNEKFANGTNPPLRDRMRTLVSRYAVSHLKSYNKERIFLELVREGGELAEDLILQAPEGAKVQMDELKRL